MCHFYGNPLSVLASPSTLPSGAVQPEHVKALRNLESFRDHVERAVEAGGDKSLQHARSLLVDDEYLVGKVMENDTNRRRWVSRLLRSVLVREAAGEPKRALSEAYVEALAGPAEPNGLAEGMRRMSADGLWALIGYVVGLLDEGDASVGLPAADEDGDVELARLLSRLRAELGRLCRAAEEGGFTLRSKYSGGGKVMRTTVIAQRVQLSQDAAALRDEDRRLTEVVDEAAGALAGRLSVWTGARAVFSECWAYGSRSPSQEALEPRPRAVFERSLGRPHDYLGCVCCGGAGAGGGLRATLPATALAYQLYLETGSLINVADLWLAFEGLAGGAAGEEDGEAGSRARLAQFYRALAELRAMGYIKASKRKTDHVAKVKWL